MTLAWRDPFIRSLEQAGHELELDNKGEVDMLALDAEPHNGPRCVKCGESWCEHCLYEVVEVCEGRP